MNNVGSALFALGLAVIAVPMERERRAIAATRAATAWVTAKAANGTPYYERRTEFGSCRVEIVDGIPRIFAITSQDSSRSGGADILCHNHLVGLPDQIYEILASSE